MILLLLMLLKLNAHLALYGPYRTLWAGALTPARLLWASWVRWTFGTAFWSRSRSSPWPTAVRTCRGMWSPGWQATSKCLGGERSRSPWRCVRSDCPMLKAHLSACHQINWCFHPFSIFILSALSLRQFMDLLLYTDVKQFWFICFDLWHELDLFKWNVRTHTT